MTLFEKCKETLEVLIIYIQVKRDGIIYEYPYTRVKTLIPIYQDTTQSEDEIIAYNFITNSYDIITREEYCGTYYKYDDEGVILCRRLKQYDETTLKPFITANLAYIEAIKVIIQRQIDIELQYINQIDDKCLSEHAELFYSINGKKRNILVAKIADQIAHDTCISPVEGNPTNISLSRALGNIDTNSLNEVKKKWVQIIEIYKNKALRQLKAEKADAERDNNTEDAEEIDIIVNIINSADAQIQEDLSNRTTFAEVVSYWPPLLLPAPRFVV